MGITDKNRPSYKASGALREFARVTGNKYLANVIHLIDSRLRYFMAWEGTCLEGDADHLSWAWGVLTELRDLNYLGLIPDNVCIMVCDLVQEAIDHSVEARKKRNERGCG